MATISIQTAVSTSWTIFLATIFMMAAGCATREDLAEVGNRVARQRKEAEADRTALRFELEDYLNKQEKMDDAYRNSYADLHAFVRELREETQEVRGEAEEDTHETRRRLAILAESAAVQEENWKKMEKQLRMTLHRLARLEEYLGLEPSEELVFGGPEQIKADKGESKDKETPEALYGEAKEHFDRGDYEDARELFQAYLDQYSQSDNADNAQFWIGEVYYQEKWYEKAILEYQKVIEKYPKGNKVSSALLKQGFAFSNLGDPANARLVLKELMRKYPSSNEARIAKKKLKTLQ